MSDRNRLLKGGIDEATCFNYFKNLNVEQASRDELELYNKIYYRCKSCEYFSKIFIIGNGKTVIMAA